MKTILNTVLVAVTLLGIGVAFYRGWLILSHPAADAGSNKVNINLTADPDKMQQDVKLVTRNATGLTDGVTEDDEADSQENHNVKTIDF